MAKHTLGKIAVGAGLAGFAAVAAGYYFYGPHGKKHRKDLKTWSIRARAEVLDEVAKLKHISADDYEKIVERVTAKYAKMKHVGAADAKKLERLLKSHWKKISAEFKKR